MCKLSLFYIFLIPFAWYPLLFLFASLQHKLRNYIRQAVYSFFLVAFWFFLKYVRIKIGILPEKRSSKNCNGCKKQCYEYCFGAHFSLSIEMEYFGTGLVQGCFGIPFWSYLFLYFFLFIILYTYISLYIICQNPYNLLSLKTIIPYLS